MKQAIKTARLPVLHQERERRSEGFQVVCVSRIWSRAKEKKTGTMKDESKWGRWKKRQDWIQKIVRTEPESEYKGAE